MNVFLSMFWASEPKIHPNKCPLNYMCSYYLSMFFTHYFHKIVKKIVYFKEFTIIRF